MRTHRWSLQFYLGSATVFKYSWFRRAVRIRIEDCLISFFWLKIGRFPTVSSCASRKSGQRDDPVWGEGQLLQSNATTFGALERQKLKVCAVQHLSTIKRYAAMERYIFAGNDMKWQGYGNPAVHCPAQSAVFGWADKTPARQFGEELRAVWVPMDLKTGSIWMA